MTPTSDPETSAAGSAQTPHRDPITVAGPVVLGEALVVAHHEHGYLSVWLTAKQLRGIAAAFIAKAETIEAPKPAVSCAPPDPADLSADIDAERAA